MEQEVKVVAEMPNDDEMREGLEEQKKNDGYPDSCGIEQPTIAPGMDTHNTLEEDATEDEVKTNDYTEVTRLYLDRTPND